MSTNPGAAAWVGDKAVAGWLFVVSGMIFSMVVVGGLTRLTKSGLSMTEWAFAGVKPPSSQAEWETEFSKYQQYPEYQKLNRDMTVNEFKFIYWMEYGHRQLGRVIGLTFLLPFAYFASTKRLAAMPGLTGRCSLILSLIVGQGLVGWWMVKSGLNEPEHNRQPRVSPYRLAAHLLSAFTIYSISLTTALDCLPKGANSLHQAALPPRLRTATAVATGLLALTIGSGAFVAGNEAGLVYNEFPLMGGSIVPQDVVDPYLVPKWRNFFENPSLVQFDHRALSLTTAAVLTTVFAQCAKHSSALSKHARLASRSMLVVTGAQVSLGILTLINYVPIPLASAHQAGALTLLSVCMWLLQSLRVGHPAKAVQAASQAAGQPLQANVARLCALPSARTAKVTSTVLKPCLKAVPLRPKPFQRPQPSRHFSTRPQPRGLVFGHRVPNIAAQDEPRPALPLARYWGGKVKVVTSS